MTIDLGPLARRTRGRWPAGSSRRRPGSRKNASSAAAGNPLFLEQLMRAADEQDDHCRRRCPASCSRGWIGCRKRDRAALRAAAVVGQRFPLALVRKLAQLPDYECDRLVAQFLVRPEGDEYLFAHALIRDGVYASLTRARRAELHRRPRLVRRA